MEAFDDCMHYLNIKYNWDTAYEILKKNELKKISQLTANQGEILQQKTWADHILYENIFIKFNKQLKELNDTYPSVPSKTSNLHEQPAILAGCSAIILKILNKPK